MMNSSRLSDAIIEGASDKRQHDAQERHWGRKVARIFASNTIKYATSDRRNKDLASHHVRHQLAWLIVMVKTIAIIVLCSSPNLPRLTAGAVLMGMWILWLQPIATNGEGNNHDDPAVTESNIANTPYSEYELDEQKTANVAVTRLKLLLKSSIMGIYIVLAFLPWNPVWILLISLLVIWIAIQHVILFVSSPAEEADFQIAFYRAIKAVLCIASTSSLVFILKSAYDWPSLLSLHSAVACIFFFAYASHMALIVAGPRGRVDMNSILFSSKAVSGLTDLGSGCCTTLCLILTNLVPALPLLLVYPHPEWTYCRYYISGYEWVAGLVCPSFLGIHALQYHNHLMKARRFHVRSDGAVLVETLNKTYVYEKVTRVFVNPHGGVIPKQTETCHVYCAASNVPIVVVELSGEKSLYLCLEDPTKFANAITQSLTTPLIHSQQQRVNIV